VSAKRRAASMRRAMRESSPWQSGHAEWLTRVVRQQIGKQRHLDESWYEQHEVTDSNPVSPTKIKALLTRRKTSRNRFSISGRAISVRLAEGGDCEAAQVVT
jgi:hypothetical protein